MAIEAVISTINLGKKALLVGLCAATLSACSQGTPAPSANSPAVAETPTQEAPTVQPELDPDSPLIARVVTQAVIEDTPVFPEVSRLSDISSESVRSLMGDPDLYRRDGNVEIMLFENTHCVLEVILSQDAGSQDYISKRVSTRTLKGAPTEGGACLKTLLPGGVFPGS